MTLRRLAAWFWGMAAILAMLLTIVDLQALDTGWYNDWYRHSDLAERLDVPEESLEEAMSMMLEYVRGDRSTMDGSLTGIGEVYNAREKAHMKDVRHLYEQAMAAKYTAWAIVGLGVVIAGWKKAWKTLALGYLQAGLCWLFLLAFLGLWAATGFTDFWTHFHELFFDNDLWLLDPATDFMIRICPESLFFDLVIRIVLEITAVAVTGGVVSWLVLRSGRR